MSEPNREAVEAAVAAHNAARLDAHGSRAAMSDALTTALPHLLAAKNAEIAALRSALGPFAAEADAQDARNRHASHDLSTYGRFTIGQCYAARAALEMSGGAK